MGVLHFPPGEIEVIVSVVTDVGARRRPGREVDGPTEALREELPSIHQALSPKCFRSAITFGPTYYSCYIFPYRLGLDAFQAASSFSPQIAIILHDKETVECGRIARIGGDWDRKEMKKPARTQEGTRGSIFCLLPSSLL